MRNVIVGGGVAALRAAEAMRQVGFEGELLLVSGEKVLPYHRPPLSKAFLTGGVARDELQIEPPSFFESQRIEVALGDRAVGLELAQRRVTLTSGTMVKFDRLLVATGSRPRALGVPGADLDGVCHLRTLEDARQLAERLTTAEHVVIIGAGLIGLEVAAVCRGQGKVVTVVESTPTPLRRVLGRFWGQAVADLHRDRGVTMRVSTYPVRFHGTDGRVRSVELNDGTRVTADVVLVATGVVPNCEWLSGSGVRIDDGIVVDLQGRTNVEGVFAGGEVASQWVPATRRRFRLEQYGAAQAHGAAVGKTMAGVPTDFTAVPGVGSEQYGIRLQAFGELRDDLTTVTRGEVVERRFITFFLDDLNRVRGAFAMGRPKDALVARKMVAKGRTLDPAAAADPQSELTAAGSG